MKVLMLAAHGLNAGYLGCYGNEWVTTAALDQLAAEGIVFDWHYADHPDPNCCCHSCFPGVYHFHRLASCERPAIGGPNVLAKLRQHGVITVLLTDPDVPLSEGVHRQWERVETLARSGNWETDLKSLFKRAEAIIDKLSPASQWLVRIESAILLPPWNPPPSFRDAYSTSDSSEDSEEQPLDELDNEGPGEQDEEVNEELTPNQSLYAAMVTCLDSGLDSFLAQLEDRGIIDEILLMVTSHWGQDVGDLTSFRKWSGSLLHEELVHLPLIIRMPGAARAGCRISTFSQPTDVAPTLLDVFKIPEAELLGSGLLALVEGSAKREYVCSGLRKEAGDRLAIRTAEWCLLRSQPPAPALEGKAASPARSLLFIKPDDRWEVSDVRNVYPDVADALEATVDKFIHVTESPGPMIVPDLSKIAAPQATT